MTAGFPLCVIQPPYPRRNPGPNSPRVSSPRVSRPRVHANPSKRHRPTFYVLRSTFYVLRPTSCGFGLRSTIYIVNYLCGKERTWSLFSWNVCQIFALTRGVDCFTSTFGRCFALFPGTSSRRDFALVTFASSQRAEPPFQ